MPKKTKDKNSNISERTLNKQRAKKKQLRRNIFFYAIIFTILVVAITISSLTIFFNIREVKITGESIYTEQQIFAATGIKLGQNMFRLNKFDIQNNVVERLPYISRIDISRRLPDILQINVVKAEGFAVISLGTGFIKIDETSKSLEQISENTDKLLELKNVKVTGYTQGKPVAYEEEDTWEVIKTITDAMKSTGIFGKITSINLEKKYDIVMEYENRVECQIGDTGKLEIKLLLMENVISENSPSEKAVVDVRDSQRAYYRPKTG